MDPLSSSSSRTFSKTDHVKPPPNDLNKMMMSKLDHQIVGSHNSSSSTSSSSSGGISAPPSVHSAMQRVEPRVTSDLVKLEWNNSMTMTTTASQLLSDPLARSSTLSSVGSSGGAASSSKPSRVIPLKPFPQTTNTLSHNKNSSVGCQSLESSRIHRRSKRQIHGNHYWRLVSRLALEMLSTVNCTIVGRQQQNHRNNSSSMDWDGPRILHRLIKQR
jgi:hypothetical protein